MKLIILIQQNKTENATRTDNNNNLKTQMNTIHWFNIDHEWSEENFSACEPDFYNFFYQMNIKGQEIKIYQLFLVQIGNGKSQKN